MLWHLDTLLKESVDWKNIDMVLLMKKKSLMEDKRNNEAQRPHTSEPHKAHLTGEFVLCQNCGCTIFCFASRFASVVRQRDEISLLRCCFLMSSHLKMFSCFKCNIQCKMD